MKLSWDKFVGKDPDKNLPSNNDDALSSVLEGKGIYLNLCNLSVKFFRNLNSN